MSSLADRFRENTFLVDRFDALDTGAVAAAVDRDSFACIRGLFSADEIHAGRESIQRQWDESADLPSLGQDPSTVRSNWQKLVIGGANTTGVDRPRCFRTLFNPLLAEDRYGLHDVFRRLASLRNRLQDLPEDYARDRVQDGLWTASRIHQYPTGGGFMAAHRDSVVKQISEDAGRRFHQVVLLMSEFGKDFEAGGGFVDSGDERFAFEEGSRIGDVVVYDGLANHGVSDIDPHRLPDLYRFGGRLAAFATLYRDLG